MREAERLDTRHAIPKVSHLPGVILAREQDYPGATERFRTDLKFAPTAEDPPKLRAQLDDAEKKITASSK